MPAPGSCRGRAASTFARTAACLLLAALTGETVQSQRPPHLDEFVLMGVYPTVRSSVYSRPANPESTLIFIGTELGLAVGIGNQTAAPVTITRIGERWEETFSIVLERAVGDATAGLTVPFRMLTGPDAETVELRPERSIEMRFALADTGALGPGVYTLSVSLPLDALDGRSRRLRNSLDRKITFEIRTPRTAAEIADAWLQMGYVATQKGRHGEARHWAERVLTVMPASVVAKVDIGFSWLRENDCAMAVPALEHAIRAIERGDDAALEMSGGSRTEWAAELARTLRRRCPG